MRGGLLFEMEKEQATTGQFFYSDAYLKGRVSPDKIWDKADTENMLEEMHQPSWMYCPSCGSPFVRQIAYKRNDKKRYWCQDCSLGFTFGVAHNRRLEDRHKLACMFLRRYGYQYDEIRDFLWKNYKIRNNNTAVFNELRAVVPIRQPKKKFSKMNIKDCPGSFQKLWVVCGRIEEKIKTDAAFLEAVIRGDLLMISEKLAKITDKEKLKQKN